MSDHETHPLRAAAASLTDDQREVVLKHFADAMRANRRNDKAAIKAAVGRACDIVGDVLRYAMLEYGYALLAVRHEAEAASANRIVGEARSQLRSLSKSRGASS